MFYRNTVGVILLISLLICTAIALASIYASSGQANETSKSTPKVVQTQKPLAKVEDDTEAKNDVIEDAIASARYSPKNISYYIIFAFTLISEITVICIYINNLCELQEDRKRLNREIELIIAKTKGR